MIYTSNRSSCTAPISSRDAALFHALENFLKITYAPVMVAIETKNAGETAKVADMLMQELQPRGNATILALQGELGAGKTTFVQACARSLGIKERVLSPTFVILKAYGAKNKKFAHFIHIDCYRLDSEKDLLHLGFKELLKDKDAIILIEWADRVKKIIPRSAIWMTCAHGTHSNERYIEIKENKK